MLLPYPLCLLTSSIKLSLVSQSGHITIWTDVDGVFSADPRKVPEAVCLQQLR